LFIDVKMTLTIKIIISFTFRSAIDSRMVELSTPRLRLRRARPADLEAFHAILSDPRAMTYWSSLPHQTLDQTRDWLAGMTDTPAALGDDFVIERDGQVIGKAGCWRRTRHRVRILAGFQRRRRLCDERARGLGRRPRRRGGLSGPEPGADGRQRRSRRLSRGLGRLRSRPASRQDWGGGGASGPGPDEFV
jgi:hypothetical protein